ncbi:hypothetical protein M0812_19360 [Anaeramoeba flamelloides]|uniref:Uncharacterized protein n=1 Tax=Anaeramoeba flamelloides TaxID=1746091 RepID=A0AAV7Z681_9EUKA|nr:hypothetical protein M0812_19360 [Anaeramoeba flamelloides]
MSLKNNSTIKIPLCKKDEGSITVFINNKPKDEFSSCEKKRILEAYYLKDLYKKENDRKKKKKDQEKEKEKEIAGIPLDSKQSIKSFSNVSRSIRRSYQQAQLTRTAFQFKMDLFSQGTYFDGTLWLEIDYFRLSLSNLGEIYLQKWTKPFSIYLDTTNSLVFYLKINPGNNDSGSVSDSDSGSDSGGGNYNTNNKLFRICADSVKQKLLCITTLLIYRKERMKLKRIQFESDRNPNLVDLGLLNKGANSYPLSLKNSIMDSISGSLVDDLRRKKTEICEQYYQRGKVSFVVQRIRDENTPCGKLVISLNKNNLALVSQNYSVKFSWKHDMIFKTPAVKKKNLKKKKFQQKRKLFAIQISQFGFFAFSAQTVNDRKLIILTIEYFIKQWKQNNPKTVQKMLNKKKNMLDKKPKK